VSESLRRNPNTECFICKKAIYRRPSEIRSGRVFCSYICYGVSCRKETPCKVCGTPILSSLNKKTCGRACANKGREGTTYTRNSLKDKVVTIRRIKIRLLAQRGKKCERCDYSNPAVLQVHHKNKNRKDNRLINLELICPNCHYEEHYVK
jgi:hypothetical protein